MKQDKNTKKKSPASNQKQMVKVQPKPVAKKPQPAAEKPSIHPKARYGELYLSLADQRRIEAEEGRKQSKEYDRRDSLTRQAEKLGKPKPVFPPKKKSPYAAKPVDFWDFLKKDREKPLNLRGWQ